MRPSAGRRPTPRKPNVKTVRRHITTAQHTSCTNVAHPHCEHIEALPACSWTILIHTLAHYRYQKHKAHSGIVLQILHILVNIIHCLHTKQNCIPIIEHRYLHDYRVFLRILMSILESLPSLSWPLLTISASLSNSVQPLMEALAHLPCVPAVCWHKLLSRPILAICLHQCIYLRPISASLDL